MNPHLYRAGGIGMKITRKIAKESWLLAAICVADLITTLWFVRGGGAIEANPIMRHYLDLGVLPFILAKSTMVLGPLAILEWARTRRPRFVTSMLRVGILLYLGSYGAIVWRINQPDQYEEMTPAQSIAFHRWVSSPVSDRELVEWRAQLR